MAVYKEEKTGTWRVIYRYTDWTGEKKQTQKRGCQTKREAQAWEREQLNKARADLDMTFKSFVEQYTADMQTRIKENTWATKEHIIRSKLLPYFGNLKMCNITAQQIITWQNELLNYKDEKGKNLFVTHGFGLPLLNKEIDARIYSWNRLKKNDKKLYGKEMDFSVFNVFGHDVQQDGVLITDNFAAIDTGCVYHTRLPNAALSALEWPSKCVISQEYCG